MSKKIQKYEHTFEYYANRSKEYQKKLKGIYFAQFEHEHYLSSRFTCLECFKKYLLYRGVNKRQFLSLGYIFTFLKRKIKETITKPKQEKYLTLSLKQKIKRYIKNSLL